MGEDARLPEEEPSTIFPQEIYHFSWQLLQTTGLRGRATPCPRRDAIPILRHFREFPEFPHPSRITYGVPGICTEFVWCTRNLYGICGICPEFVFPWSGVTRYTWVASMGRSMPSTCSQGLNSGASKSPGPRFLLPPLLEAWFVSAATAATCTASLRNSLVAGFHRENLLLRETLRENL